MKLKWDFNEAKKVLQRNASALAISGLFIVFLINLVSWPSSKRESPVSIALLEVPKLPEEPISPRKASVIPVSGIEIISRPRNLNAIPPGMIFQAKLSSGASNGFVKAEVTEGLLVNNEILIPEGSALVGQGTSSEERLFIQFNQVVFKDGSFGNFSAIACDKEDQMMGVRGSLVGKKFAKIASGVGLGFLGGFSAGFQEPSSFGSPKPSVKNALLNGTATTALEESRKMLSDLKNQMPIMEVKAGTEICVIASGGS